MNDLTSIGQQLMSEVAQYLNISANNIAMSPIVLDGESTTNPDDWVGLQYVYQTAQNPPTRLQVIFGDSNLGLMVPTSPLAKERAACDKISLRRDWFSMYDKHPDPKVKAQLIILAQQLEESGFVSYGISWEKEFLLMEKERRDELAGLSGLFFPLIHFYQPDLKYDVVVRCEPVVQLAKQKA